MTEELERALAICLEAMEDQRLTLEECLELFPDHRAELEVLLRVAMDVAQAPAVQPSLGFRLHARRRLLRRLGDRPARLATSLKRLRAGAAIKPLRSHGRRSAASWLAIVSLILVLLGGVGTGLAFAADGSKPGDPLYGVDTGIEALQLATALGQESRGRMALQLADERIDELQDLADEGSAAESFQLAVDGYRRMVESAAEALASAVATGDAEGSAALASLLQASLSVHGQVLDNLEKRVPQTARSSINDARTVSERGKLVVEELLSGGMPGGPASTPGVAPTGPPAGHGKEESTPGDPPAPPTETEAGSSPTATPELPSIFPGSTPPAPSIGPPGNRNH